MTLIDWEALGRNSDPCLVCGSPDHQTLYAPTYRGSIEDASTYFLAQRTATAHGPIVQCSSCKFVFTSPRFAAAEYDRIYGGVRPPVDLDPAFEAAKAARFHRLASIVRRFQPTQEAFLDFGCGDGNFLKAFGSPAGRGFEVGPEGRRMAGPCEVITGDWASVAGSDALPADSLDFVSAFDVLEHLPRIQEDLALIRTVLKPGGIFFASVPNIDSFVARAMGKRWNMLLLEHLWYFSPETYRRMMERSGFEVLEMRPVPFDAPLAHLATRLAQTFGMTGSFKVGPISKLVLPVPAGIMLGVFRRTD